MQVVGLFYNHRLLHGTKNEKKNVCIYFPDLDIHRYIYTHSFRAHGGRAAHKYCCKLSGMRVAPWKVRAGLVNPERHLHVLPRIRADPLKICALSGPCYGSSIHPNPRYVLRDRDRCWSLSAKSGTQCNSKGSPSREILHGHSASVAPRALENSQTESGCFNNVHALAEILRAAKAWTGTVII